MDQVWDLYRKYVNPGQVDLISTFGFGRDLVKTAEGVWIETADGRRILDFTGGIGVLNHGHNHPRLLKVRKDFQDRKKMEVHKNYFSPYLAALSHNIALLLPGDLEVSYFPNSGAEAVEGSVKMAYKYHNGNRKSILHSKISFHGKLLGAASLTASPELDYEFPRIPNCISFEWNSLGSVESLIETTLKEDGSSDLYAIIIEPMSGSSLRICSEIFLRGVRNLCDMHDIILIFDEVYTGWAKTGYLFNFMRVDDLIPDILVSSKSFGGGKSTIAAYIARRKVFMKAYGNMNDATLHSTTYNGFGEETVTALEAVNIIVEENFVDRAQEIGKILKEKLTKLQSDYPSIISDVRGEGALWGILIEPPLKGLKSLTEILPSKFFKDKRFIDKLVTAAVIEELYSEHNILTFYGSNEEIPLIISPSIVVKDVEINMFVDALDTVFKKGLIPLVLKLAKKKFFR